MLLEAMFSYDTLVNKKAWDSLSPTPNDRSESLQRPHRRGQLPQDMYLKDQSVAEMAKAG